MRGSAPVFWEQKSRIGVVNPRPRVSRVLELTTAAMGAHVRHLAKMYGPPLLLSLLDHKGDEAELSAFLIQCVDALARPPQSVPARMMSFDFHAAVKGQGRPDAPLQRQAQAPHE